MVVLQAHALPEHPGDPWAAPAGLSLHGLEQLGLKTFIVSGSFGSIVESGLSEPQDFTRPLDAEIELLADGRNCAPLGLGAYHFPRITS